VIMSTRGGVWLIAEYCRTRAVIIRTYARQKS